MYKNNNLTYCYLKFTPIIIYLKTDFGKLDIKNSPF